MSAAVAASFIAPRLGQSLCQLLHLMLQPVASQALVAQVSLGCLHPPVQLQHRIRRPADGEQ
jgi:hypothetical protein